MNTRKFICSICSASADGVHYGALSCRSCNAFFRRSVVENVEYRCKYLKKCVIDTEARCSCRFCRFHKCLAAGMKPAAVQPRRDPTGAQKNRFKKSLGSPLETFHTLQREEYLLISIWEVVLYLFIHNDLQEEDDCFDQKYMFEKSRASLELPSESAFFSPIRSLFQRNLNYEGTSHVEDHFEFICSVRFYNQHLRMMQLSFSTISSFLDMMQNKATLKEISPLEMEKLRNVELNGVFSWLDSITAYKHLSSADQENLLKRYSIRKVSLDRFYIASLHVYELQRKNFVLNNNTFIPPNRTGFEVVEEDEKQIKFKNETFAETNARSWKNVVLRFTDLSIKDAEVVYLQYMLLWSVANYAYVSGDAKKMMKDQRNRVMSNLFEYYSLSKTEEPEVRFAEITMLLGELEEVFDMHCLDIQIFEVFGLSGLGNTWYVDVCHSQLNNPRLEWDFNMIENLKDLNFRNIQQCAKKWKISCLNE